MAKYLKFLLMLSFMAACMPQTGERPGLKVPDIRVLLTEISDMDSIGFAGNYQLKSEEAAYEFGRRNRQVYIKRLDDGYKIYNENRIFTFRTGDKVVFKPVDDFAQFHLGGKKFAGEFHLQHTPEGKIALINALDLESYLKGVVPHEIPSDKAEKQEAVKAQAICARTYALSRLEQNRKRPFDVYADVRDQVYGGISQHSRIADDAVDETHGTVIMYRDTLATIFYHSNSGGILEAAENVWPAVKKPYLASRKDVLGKTFISMGKPLYRWETRRTLADIDSVYRKRFQLSPLSQTVQDTTMISLEATVLKRSVSGRVQSMTVTFGDTTLQLEGYDIRRFFSTPDGRALPSTLFSLSAEGDSVLVFRGGGFGHGVGMSQWGAVNMAEKGYRYYHILKHYFPDTYLKKVY